MAIDKKNSIKTVISVDSSGAQKGINKVGNSAKSGSKQVKLFGKSFNLLTVGIGAAVAAFTLIVKKGAEFSKALSGLQAVSGATNKEMKVLSKQAKDLGASTAFTASEVVSLQTELAKLGNSASDIKKSTPAILNLAASLEVDLASAAAFAGSTVNAFGLKAEDTQRIVDVMAESAASSAQDFTTLKESFTQAAPAASALGVSVEKTSALLGVLANSGITGGAAGTALKNSFIELKKEGLSLQDGLDKIANSSDKLGTAIELAGKRGGPALLILSKNQQGIGLLEDKLNGAAGAAEKMAEVKLDNLSGDVTKLQSAFEGFVLGIFDGSGALNSFLRGIVQGASDMLNFFTNTEKVSDSMREQQTELYLQEAAVDRLDKVINDATTSQKALVKAQEDRVKIIKEMIKSNPELLAGIDAETVATAQLKDNLVEVNRALVKKLIIQEKEEEFQAQAVKTKDALLEVMEQEKLIQEGIAGIRAEAAKEGIRIDETDSKGFQRRIDQLKAEGKLGLMQKARYDNLLGLINKQKINQQVLNYEEQKGVDLLKVKEELLGKSEKTVVKKTARAAGGEDLDALREGYLNSDGPVVPEETDKEKKAREKREAKEQKLKEKEAEKRRKEREKRRQEVAKFNQDLADDKADQDADTEKKEIELERQRHLKELDDLKLKGDEVNGQRLAINALYDEKEKLRASEAKIKTDKENEEKRFSEAETQLEIDAIKLQAVLDADELKYAEQERIQLEFLERKRLHDISAADLTAKQIEEINERAAKAKKDVKDKEEKIVKDADKAMLESGLNMAADAFGIAQEVAVAKMLMAAPEAISNVWSQAAKQPTIPQVLLHGAVGTATTVAPIVKGLADIKKTRFSKATKPAPSGTISTSGAGVGGGATGVGVTDLSNIAANNASRLGLDTSLSSNASQQALSGSAIGGMGASVVFSENAYTDFQDQVRFREDRTTVGG